MDDSFQLLSTMSPRVKEGYKVTKKVTSVLALKKHFRRSSIFDKQKKTINNDSLIIIESSTSGNSSDISLKPRQSLKKNDIPTIEISDSDVSDEDVKIPSDFKRNIQKDLDNVNLPLSDQKIHDIEEWIGKVQTENKNPKLNVTAFSQVSTIFGDELGGNFQVEGAAGAVNSTQIGPDYCRFDELFKKKQVTEKDDLTEYNFKKGSQDDKIPKCEDESNKYSDSGGNVANINDIDKSLGNLCIDDSFEENIQQRLSTDSRKSNNRKSIDKPILNNDNTNAVNNGNKDLNLEYESMLDDLYGKSWRKNKEHVLPKSEPKKRNKPKGKVQNVPKTERKANTKPRSNNLLQNLQKASVLKNIESPWVDRLKNICDSDTASESSPEKHPVRIKLNFGDENENNQTDNNTTSKYFKKTTQIMESDKENFSDLSESLEERIRKKLNNVDIRHTKTKNETKPKTKVTKKLTKKVESSVDLNKYREPSISRSSDSDKQSSISSEDNIPGKKTTRNKVQKNYVETSSDEWATDTSNQKIVKDRLTETKKTWTFLESLSANVPIQKCDMSARIFRNNFKEYKGQLAEKLFKLYNVEIFENCIPTDTPIEWNDRMRGSAGYCYCKKITRRTGVIERSVRIALSTKVVDSADRLRDTLVHELCHAATWLVNNVSDGHGPFWKAWASKAIKRFPELPCIKRCHDYVINTKYTYKCSGCGYSIGRHSKSLDIERKRCGYCYGKFEVLINKTSKKGETKSVPATPKREPTAFAKFVKENYSQFRTPNRKHGEVMKILGQKFGEIKTTSA